MFPFLETGQGRTASMLRQIPRSPVKPAANSTINRSPFRGQPGQISVEHSGASRTCDWEVECLSGEFVKLRLILGQEQFPPLLIPDFDVIMHTDQDNIMVSWQTLPAVSGTDSKLLVEHNSLLLWNKNAEKIANIGFPVGIPASLAASWSNPEDEQGQTTFVAGCQANSVVSVSEKPSRSGFGIASRSLSSKVRSNVPVSAIGYDCSGPIYRVQRIQFCSPCPHFSPQSPRTGI